MTAGKADLINKYFAGSAYTAAWYLGLKNTVASNATDVLSNHGWGEVDGYGANRPAITFGTVGTGVNSVSQSASYGFTGAATVAGAFICNAQATTSNTGVLYSAGDFTASRAVVSNDTLNVTVTVSFA